MSLKNLVPALLALAAAFDATAAPAPVAPPQLEDGPGGVTCHHYAAHARLAWREPGGDWIDAEGRPRGVQPLARQAVQVQDGLQAVRWDLTALLRERGADAQPLALMLRALGPGGGVVDFRSREHGDPQARPALRLEWEDGTRTSLAPIADTSINCTTHSSIGGEARLQIDAGQPVLLVFPGAVSAASPGRRPVRATLELASHQQYGSGAEIGVFLAAAPGPRALPPEPGLARGFPLDAGIESHPDVLHAERFDAPDARRWSDLLDAGRTQIVAEDRGNGFVPLDGRALRVTIPRGSNRGANAHLRFAALPGGEPEEAYFRYHLRLARNWNPVVDGGKLPGFSGTYGRAGWGMRASDGHNGWSARGAFLRQGDAPAARAGWRAIGSYVYHADADDSGEIWGWNLGPTGLLQQDRWYSIEQHLKLNTPGRSDGVLRAWIDGQLVFERRGLRFRDVPSLRIESVWLNVYHGGIEPAPHEMTLFIDNLVVARRYIGPAAVKP